MVLLRWLQEIEPIYWAGDQLPLLEEVLRWTTAVQLFAIARGEPCQGIDPEAAGPYTTSGTGENEKFLGALKRAVAVQQTIELEDGAMVSTIFACRTGNRFDDSDYVAIFSLKATFRPGQPSEFSHREF
ncbi:MAG: hypothetical protein HOE53_01140 [Candidatus Magasanikbacteria bacterium]|nr:hypothetical protein [Candidatus Magasanikbacteria bacterium]